MIIYLIKNLLNGHKYIGKTKLEPQKRFQLHKNNARRGIEYHLYRAMRLYGVENFVMETWEIVGNLEDLNEREIYWITELKPEYNMTKGGDGGDTSSSPKYQEYLKTIDMRGPKNPMYGKKGDLNPNKGSKRSENQKDNLRRGLKNAWDKNLSRKELHRLQMEELNERIGKYRKNAIPIRFETIEYVSLAEASRKTLRSVYFIKKNCELL